MEQIFNNKNTKTNTENPDTSKLADVAPVSKCIYCTGKNIIRKGLRQKKHK